MTVAAVEPTEQPFAFKVRTLKGRGDLNFVCGTWLRSYMSAPFTRRLAQADYSHWHGAIVNSIVSSPSAVIMLAEHARIDDLLLGYAVGRSLDGTPHVDYVYTKGDFRELGIARACVDALLKRLGGGPQVVFTHSRSPATSVALRRGWHFNPYPALCMAPHDWR